MEDRLPSKTDGAMSRYRYFSFSFLPLRLAANELMGSRCQSARARPLALASYPTNDRGAPTF